MEGRTLKFVLTLSLVVSVVSALCLPASADANPVKDVFNSDPGLWGQERELGLVTDLKLGEQDGPDEFLFGRISGVSIGPAGDIYVLDNGFVRVQRYDSNGKFKQSIGQRGEGPGEFSFPTALAVARSGVLYVADMTRVTLFDANGEYSDDFRHEQQRCLPRAICVGRNAEVYISCFDVLEQLIIHRYDAEHKLLSSFCDSYAVGDDDIDVRVEELCAGGDMDLGPNGNIFFTQQTPFEIRIFDPSGRLLTVVHRDTDLLQPPAVETNDDRISIGMFASSSAIVVLNEKYFVNEIKTPPNESGATITLIDLFDIDGTLLLTKRVDRDIHLFCADREGRLYGVDMEGYPKLVRYRLTF